VNDPGKASKADLSLKKKIIFQASHQGAGELGVI